MTSLRLRMLEDMQIRNLAVNTQEAYVQQVSLVAKTSLRKCTPFDLEPRIKTQLGPPRASARSLPRLLGIVQVFTKFDKAVSLAPSMISTPGIQL
jgi:hypothetical protein